MRIAMTGGIACGKSLAARYLREEGIATIDADDIVHELIPEEERKRIAAAVFANEEARKALEKRIHPLVMARLDEAAAKSEGILVEIIPLLFECKFDEKYDIILAVFSPPTMQIDRMMRTRGYTKEQAEARLRAQIPAEKKAELADYAINNCGTAEELKTEIGKMISWLKQQKQK